MTELHYSVRTNSTFDLKQLVKMHYTQKNLSKKLHISREQLNNILNSPDTISLDRLNSILQYCGYQLQLTITKI